MKAHIQKSWSRYCALWHELSGWKLFLFYILHYTALFAILWPLLFSAFRETGKSYAWTFDAIPYHLRRMIYLSQTIRNGIQDLLAGRGWTIPLYDFRLGPTVLEQVEVIQFLAVLWPWDREDVLYDALVVVRYYLTGVSFSAFGFYFKQKPLPVVIGALSYTFCGFTLLAGVRHPYFMGPVIFLPLLVVGLEKVIRRERSFLLIIVVCLALISDIYFACMLAVIAVIYVLVRFPALYLRNRAKEFIYLLGRLAIGGGTGIALSGIVTVPILLHTFGTGRIGRNITLYENLLHYSKTYYQKFLSDFVLISGDNGTWTCLGFSVLAVPAIILLFAQRTEKHKSLRISFVMLTAMMLLPATAYVMSGFNSVTNRWCFAYAFCVCAVIMFQLPYLIDMDRCTEALVGIFCIVYIIICYFVIDHTYYHENVIVFLVLSLSTLALFRIFNSQKKAGLFLLSLLVTCFSIYYSSFLLYDTSQNNYVAEFTEKNKAYEHYTNSQYGSFSQSRAMAEDDAFYRVAGNITAAAHNSAFYFGINGLSYYTSYSYPAYREWTDELEVPHDLLHRRSGLDSRAPMLTLAGVKYFVLRENSNEIAPYGFQEVERVSNHGQVDIVLENKFALPVGYTYDAYISDNDYKMLSPLEKQETQLQAVVLNSEPNSVNIAKTVPETTAYQIPAIIADCNGVDWHDGILNVTEKNGTIVLAFDGSPETNTYLRIVNLDLTDGANRRRWSLTASTGKTLAQGTFYADAYIYANGMKTQLLDLGYTTEGYTTCTITFPSKGTFRLEALEIWCQPMSDYEEEIHALQEDVLENVETNWRGITGTISTTKDKILCLSIPYSRGWTAYIDGQRAKIYQANTAFMAVELTPGEHEIELCYWTPGLTAGLCLSGVGVISVVVQTICRYREKLSYSVTKRQIEKRKKDL